MPDIHKLQATCANVSIAQTLDDMNKALAQLRCALQEYDELARDLQEL